MEKNLQQLKVEQPDQGKRIDRFLADQKAYSSRSAVKKAYQKALIQLNGSLLHSLDYKVKLADQIGFQPLPLEQWKLEPIFHPLEIVFEDPYYLVVLKPAGMLTHSSATNKQPSLVNHLLYYTEQLAAQDVFRPGIVHRLDKDTSGLLIIAKTNQALDLIKQEFSRRAIEKNYYALVVGKLSPPAGKIEEPLGRHRADRKKFAVVSSGGKYALSLYRVLEKTDQLSLLQVQIVTGRTHQIRVHLQHLGHPILGDKLYGGAGKKFWQVDGQRIDYTPPYLCLHACRLRFTHPFTGQTVELSAPLSAHFKQTLALFGFSDRV